jgi:mRNA degradation ribonuclease J1/J2
MTKTTKQNNLRIIPLGGLGEVGRNMILFEYKGKILIVDMGLGFPEENMPGIDCTIPNISYLKGWFNTNIYGFFNQRNDFKETGRFFRSA